MSSSQGQAGTTNTGVGADNDCHGNNGSGNGNANLNANINGKGNGNGNGSGNANDKADSQSSSSGGSSSQLQSQQQVVPPTNNANTAADSSPRESGDDSEDESEILEESPCGRWLKRREEVDQRDVPGIDCVHLAMDTEEGVEVVWNEVKYTSLQQLKSHEEQMLQAFDNLLQLDHQNIVKFHRYWTDVQHVERPRLIFITEYMSSGSLKQFLKRTKRNAKRLPLEAWRRWCTQILSALTYLHSCIPPIIHGNLTCDSIFIQHNGLVKIGTVVPDAVQHSLSQQQNKPVEQMGVSHFRAPEYETGQQITASSDIYAFGMCALEMAALEIQNSTSSETSSSINEETILKTINGLEHDLQRDLIYKCLRRNSRERPTANELLFHPLLFEVHSLKLLAAHCLIFSPRNHSMFSETLIDGMMQRLNRPDVVMAYVKFSSTDEETETNPNDSNKTPIPNDETDMLQQTQQQQLKNSKCRIYEYHLSDVPSADKLEKFVEDVKFGVYPLTAFSGKKPPHFRSRAVSPERVDSVKSASPVPVDIESRRIVNMMCSVKKVKEDCNDILMTILLRMDDKMNRQLSCSVTVKDNALDLTKELVRLGFVHVDDQEKLQGLLDETLRSTFTEGGSVAGEWGTQERTFSAAINEPNNLAAGFNSSGNANSNTNGNGKNNGNTKVQKISQGAQIAATRHHLERNWSVADTQTNALLQAQSPIQVPATITSPMPTAAATVTALNLSGTVTVPMVTADPLAGTVMYVPHEQMQALPATATHNTQDYQQHNHNHTVALSKNLMDTHPNTHPHAPTRTHATPQINHNQPQTTASNTTSGVFISSQAAAAAAATAYTSAANSNVVSYGVNMTTTTSTCPSSTPNNSNNYN